MRSARVFLAMALSLSAASGCRRAENSAETRIWLAGSGEMPALMKAEQFGRAERSVMVGDEIVALARQRWGEAEIEGGSLVRIERAGAPVYGRADFLHDPERPVAVSRDEVRRLHERRFQFAEEWRRRNPPARGRFAADPALVLLPSGRGFVAAYRLEIEEGARGVFRFFVTPGGALLRTEKASTDLFDAEAWIYTLADGKSVQEVLLRKLLEGASVRSLTHEVASQAPLSAGSDRAPWRFPTADPRFDQVQVFYHVREALDFFANGLGFKLPVKIEAETAVGYPEETSAAFAYGNRIRFGSGDGVKFRSLAQDPSVVIHEVGHILNGVLANLPTQGEGGSLNEAFADYFAAACLGDPRMGARAAIAGPLRNLENTSRYADRKGALYPDSLIVSGTLWELRRVVGPETANKLALKTLARLGAARALADFPPALRAAAGGLLDPAGMTGLNATLRKRGWEEP